MKNNVGNLDSSVRIVIGLGLLGATISGSIGAWGVIAIVPLATGLLGTCPLYSLLGINTCAAPSRHEH